MPERPDARTRRRAAERAMFRCEYCMTPIGIVPSPFSSEHILPRSKGGDDTLENLALSCQGCNGHKGAKTIALDPATRKTVSLFHPRLHTWNDHFGWSANGTRIEGRTPIGRATVLALQLNRTGLQNLRRLMVLADLHPSSFSGK
jgi:hypothetical protein